MNEESHSENNIDFGFPELNVIHKKKKKRKKNEYVDLQTVDKCLRILTKSTFFDNCEKSRNKQDRKKKHKNKSHDLNNTEEFTDNGSKVVSREKHKIDKESHELNSIFPDRSKINISYKSKKKHKESQDLVNTIFPVGSELNANHKSKKKRKESHDLNSIFPDRSELNASHKNKKKRKKNKEHHDLSVIEENSFPGHSEVTLNNKEKKNSKENQNLNITEEFADDSFETVSLQKHRKKHKKKNQSIIEENTLLVDPETISIDKQKKDRKIKENCDVNVAEKISENNSYIKCRKKRKMDDESQDLNNVDHDCSEFNLARKSKKHKKNKECQDFNFSGKTSVFDESEILNINKGKKKKQKKSKESCDLNKTEEFADDYSEVPRKKHTMEKANNDLKNISADRSEFITHKHKKKKYHDLGITKKSTVDSELTSINEQVKKKHKKVKECHDLNKAKEFSDNNSEVISAKKCKRNEESHDLNIMDLGNPKHNVTHKHKKKNKESHYLGIFAGTTLFNNSEVTSIDKQTNKQHKKTKESWLENASKEFGNNFEIVSGMKCKRNEESCDLNNVNLESSESNLIHKNKKHPKENTFLSEFEMDSIHKQKKKKHKKVKESYDSNATEEFSDNAEIISVKKHKANEESQVLNNTDFDNSECNLTPGNKKHKKNYNLSRTETFSVFDNSELTSTKNRKRKKHKEGEENSDLNTIETVNHLDYSEIASSKKRKKDKKKSKNFRNEENEENCNKEVDENHKRHQHSDYNLSFPNNMLKEKNKDSSNIDESNKCQLSIQNSKSIRDSEIIKVSAAESNIELADNSDQSSSGSEDFNIIEENRRKISENEELLDLDFTEDFLEFEVPHLHATETVRSLTEKEKNHLLSQGVTIKTGKFTSKEDAILKKNFENFTKKYGVSDPIVLFGIGRYGIHKGIRKFIKAKHFYARLGKDLDNRTLYSIYKRARKIIQPYKNKGKFDKKDVLKMKEANEFAYKKWSYIGDLLKRSGDNCLQAYKWHAKPISKGKWTEEEKKILNEAIKTVSGSSDLSCDKIKGINWQAVAEYIPTRNYSQCRQYWSNNFSWKSGALKQKWDKSCYVKLIEVLSKEWNVEDASMIDWCKVHESFVNVAPSYTFMKKRWSYLKSRIPNYKNKNYSEIIKLLCQKYYISQ